MPVSPALKLRLINLWPPFAGAGIRVRQVGGDPLAFEARMALRGWNRNYVGTHFGGSLYAMTDPFYMLILIRELGSGFTVWDKAATIRFRRPGRGTVVARFEIPRERIEEIRREVEQKGRAEPDFTAEVRDSQGELVAEVDKRISVRRRERTG
jgi:acyl-coenzyme A thioesterase PaaI-like protein